MVFALCHDVPVDRVKSYGSSGNVEVVVGRIPKSNAFSASHGVEVDLELLHDDCQRRWRRARARIELSSEK